jgi:hypothetical protein
MDIKSINEFIRFDNELDLYNLVEPTLIYLDDVPGVDVTYKNFLVEEYHEMRIDLLFRDMYELEPNEVGIYLGNIDIICFINDIDNPINIVKGMLLRYPSIEDFDKFRFSDDQDNFNKKQDVRSKLVVPNKSTRKDKDRQKFKENGFSLPPVVLEKPRPPVRIKNGRFSVGGL